MTSTVLLSWESMRVGQLVGKFSPNFDDAHVHSFKTAVDPHSEIYRSEIPPSLAFDTLHAVKEFIELPQGTVHSKEAIQFHGIAEPHLPTTVEIFVADKSVRKGKQNFTLEYRAFSGDAHVLTAYKSFVIPGVSAEAEKNPIAFDFGLFGNTLDATHTYALSDTKFQVTQELLDSFGEVTATDGPIHSDPEIATPQFGGTILQGMYLFELTSQRMSCLSSTERWLQSGKIAAKFVGSSITGETVSIATTIRNIDEDSKRIHCSFEARTDSGRTVFVAEAEGPLDSKLILEKAK